MKITTVLLAALLASSCVRQTDVRGSFPAAEVLATAGIGDGKAKLQSVLGSPSVIPAFQDKVWLYIGSEMTKRAFFDMEEEKRQVIRIGFDDDGNVAEIKTLSMTDGMKLDFSRDATELRTKEYGVVQQLIGNIGRFNTQPGGR